MRAKSVGAFVVVVVLAAALELRELAAAAGLSLPRLPMPYGRSTVDNLAALALVVGASVILARGARWNVVRNLGIAWAGWRGPLLTLAATAPFWIGLGCLGKLSHDFTATDLFFTALFFPIIEEIVFRGFGFIFARRALGWPMVVAVSLQAVAFGLVHWLSAGADLAVSVQVFALTFCGGLLFAVLDAAGGFAIWNGYVFHASLNAAWTVFAVSANASTGWTGNALRFGSAALALVLAYALKPTAKPH